MESILQTTQLTKAFGGLVAVDHVDFSIQKGTVCGLIGPNGSGKSTFLNLISGFYTPDSGTVVVDSETVTFDLTHTHVYKGIARTFQHTRVFDGLTVAENVMGSMLFQSNAGWYGKLMRLGKGNREYNRLMQESRAILEGLGLGPIADKNAAKIPHGQQRFMEIARALAAKPKVLLLDEPAAGMTNQEIDHLKQILMDFRKQGLTVIIIEHNTGLVKDVSDQITVLNFGKTIADGDPHKVLQDSEVIKAYLGGDFVA